MTAAAAVRSLQLTRPVLVCLASGTSLEAVSSQWETWKRHCAVDEERRFFEKVARDTFLELCQSTEVAESSSASLCWELNSTSQSPHSCVNRRVMLSFFERDLRGF